MRAPQRRRRRTPASVQGGSIERAGAHRSPIAETPRGRPVRDDPIPRDRCNRRDRGRQPGRGITHCRCRRAQALGTRRGQGARRNGSAGTSRRDRKGATFGRKPSTGRTEGARRPPPCQGSPTKTRAATIAANGCSRRGTERAARTGRCNAAVSTREHNWSGQFGDGVGAVARRPIEGASGRPQRRSSCEPQALCRSAHPTTDVPHWAPRAIAVRTAPAGRVPRTPQPSDDFPQRAAPRALGHQPAGLDYRSAAISRFEPSTRSASARMTNCRKAVPVGASTAMSRS